MAVPPHIPLPVAGYTTQSSANVMLVNQNKLLEELVLRQVDRHVRDDKTQDIRHDLDQRLVSIARTHFMEGFMALNRAVFQPTRLTPSGADYERMIADTEDLVAMLIGTHNDS